MVMILGLGFMRAHYTSKNNILLAEMSVVEELEPKSSSGLRVKKVSCCASDSKYRHAALCQPFNQIFLSHLCIVYYSYVRCTGKVMATRVQYSRDVILIF